MPWVHRCGLRFAWMRYLSEWEHGGDVGGVGAGQDVSEGLGRARKYAIFIAMVPHGNSTYCNGISHRRRSRVDLTRSDVI
jgi:hypothetical protein